LNCRFLDSTGTQRKKSSRFFKFSKLGSSEYETDSSTAGLWHFDTLDELNDSSGNNVHFTSNNYGPTTGYLGNAQTNPVTSAASLALNCRSFTLEGHFKVANVSPNTHSLIGVSGSSLLTNLNLNSTSGTLHLQMNSNGRGIDELIPLAFPTDGGFHHVALVYDGSRGFSQVLVLVDGQVKMVKDFVNTCNFKDNFTVSVGQYDVVHFDEVRISKSARYQFNLFNGALESPAITSLNKQNGETVTSNEDYVITFSGEDSSGVDLSRTKLIANGEPVQLTASSKKKGFGTIKTDFTSAAVPLIPGANVLKVVVTDSDGNQAVSSLMVYKFLKLISAPYSTDGDTVFLYHMDEASGDFIDASGITGNLSNAGWTQAQLGVFGSSASTTTTSTSVTTPDSSNFTSFSVEAWINFPEYVNFRAIMRRDNADLLFVQNNTLHYKGRSHPGYYVAPLPPADGEFHHFAVVYDSDHPNRNLYLLMDGKVKASFTTPVSSAGLSSGNVNQIGSILYGAIDEIRMSSSARYELVSDQVE